MRKKIAGVLLTLLGIVAAIGWSFSETAHFESADTALGGDLVDKGRILWQPESGFVLHAVLSQFVAIALGVMGIVLVARRSLAD
ncbi:hypothetical protein JXA88_14550 [Candidatus Fermentibacteria bacterium]|nr:hypothetical protein [Candidatus Fermentibacteria bacterium]